MDLIGGVFLQFVGGYYGGTIGTVLAAWEQAGVFSYMLPFLLLFALIYGVMIQVKLFGGKEDSTGRIINAIIALSVSLLALQFNFVPRFFAEVFPRAGVGLAILLLFLIFTSMFADPNSRWMMYSTYALGAAIIIIALILTANSLGIYSYLPGLGGLGWNWTVWLSWVALVAIIGIVVAAGKEKTSKNAPESILVRALKGN